MFGKIAEHIEWLIQILKKCKETGFSINPTKCAFLVSSGMLLGHIVSKKWKYVIDPTKLPAIMEAPIPKGDEEDNPPTLILTTNPNIS